MNNKGSSTVEMCFIIPIVLGIVFMTIVLYLDVIGDGINQGNAFSEIYCYSENEEGRECDIYEVDGYVVGKPVKNMSLSSLRASRDNAYKTEYDLCTSRLRRWQLYGDALQE